MFVSAALLLAPISKIGESNVGIAVDVVGAMLFFAVIASNYLISKDPEAQVDPA